MATSNSRKLYLSCPSKSVTCPQILGYTLGKTLGSGKFAKVKAAWSPYEGRMIAIKILNKSKLDEEDVKKFLPREISILQKVSHPNIIGTFQIVETERHCFIALEIAENGDLLDYFNFRGHLPEEEARHIFQQMCQAISYIHSLGIAHRDIKLENVFFNKYMDVKLGDFGFALESQSNFCSTPCGSYSYGAPEIVLSPHPHYNPLLADSWSMGVVLYTMVMSNLPFGDDNQIISGLANYHHLPMDGKLISEEYEQLVRSLLSADITARSLVADVLTHVWMTSFPSVRPSWEGPREGKYNIKNSLPSIFHRINPSDSSCYDVEIHSPRLPSGNIDQLDMMTAMKAETALPVKNLSGSEVQEDHVNPASDTVAPALSSCSKVQDHLPLGYANNLPSLADKLTSSKSILLISNPLPESAESITQLAGSGSLTKPDSLTQDEAGKATEPEESESTTSEEQDNHPSALTNTTLPAKSVAPTSMEKNSHLSGSTTNAAMPARSESSTFIETDNHHDSATTTTLPTKSMSHTSLKNDKSSSGTDINTTVSDQTISSTSIEQTNHSSDPANITVLLPEPELSPVMERAYSLGQADNANQPACVTIIPAMDSGVSTSANARQKQRKKHNLVARLQSAVCRRIFSSLRKGFNVL